MVTVRGLSQSQCHVHGHTQHTPQLVALATEQTSDIFVGFYVRKQQVMKASDHFWTRPSACLCDQCLHIVGHLLNVAQNQLIEQRVVGHAVMVVHACEQGVVDILIGGQTQRTEHAEHGHGVLKPRKRNQRQTVRCGFRWRRNDQEMGKGTAARILGDRTYSRIVLLLGLVVDTLNLNFFGLFHRARRSSRVHRLTPLAAVE